MEIHVRKTDNLADSFDLQLMGDQDQNLYGGDQIMCEDKVVERQYT